MAQHPHTSTWLHHPHDGGCVRKPTPDPEPLLPSSLFGSKEEADPQLSSSSSSSRMSSLMSGSPTSEASLSPPYTSSTSSTSSGSGGSIVKSGNRRSELGGTSTLVPPSPRASSPLAPNPPHAPSSLGPPTLVPPSAVAPPPRSSPFLSLVPPSPRTSFRSSSPSQGLETLAMGTAGPPAAVTSRSVAPLNSHRPRNAGAEPPFPPFARPVPQLAAAPPPKLGAAAGTPAAAAVPAKPAALAPAPSPAAVASAPPVASVSAAAPAAAPLSIPSRGARRAEAPGLKRKRPPMLDIPARGSAFTAAAAGAAGAAGLAGAMRGGAPGRGAGGGGLGLPFQRGDGSAGGGGGRGVTGGLLGEGFVMGGGGGGRGRCAEEDVTVVGSARFGAVCQRGRRREVMEDRFHAEETFGGNAEMAYYAVFDGHGGVMAADFSAKNLHLNLLSSIGGPSACVRASPDDVEAAFVDAFRETDKQFLAQGCASGTACVACVRTADGHVVVAHAGDCRAVLCHADGCVEALTDDHKASRVDEQRRIEELGGHVDNFTGVWRVQGTMAVTRGIGDAHLKEYITPTPDTRSVLVQRNTPAVAAAVAAAAATTVGSAAASTTLFAAGGEDACMNELESGAVAGLENGEEVAQGDGAARRSSSCSCHPGCQRVCMERSSTSPFLILASDGLWDMVSNDEAVAVAAAILRTPSASHSSGSICTSSSSNSSNSTSSSSDVRWLGGDSSRAPNLLNSTSSSSGSSSSSSRAVAPPDCVAPSTAMHVDDVPGPKSGPAGRADESCRLALSSEQLQAAGRKLVDLAVKRGSMDDVCVLIVAL